MNYRRELDGLRALAVLPVILFHAGFTTFSGGFVGVDIFFVISGYLITTILLSEIEKGSFSLINFYERRARRILPALFAVITVSLLFAWLCLWPRDMKDFSKSVVNVCIYLSNRLFNKNTDYFDTSSELIPLLHTWSLSVEEQFYIFFPLILLSVWKWQKKFILYLLLGLALASLTYSQIKIDKDPSAAFFLLSSRLWELTIGSLVAWLNFSKLLTFNGNHTGSLVGFLLILYAIFFFDKGIPFPGVYALIPTFGAALIIMFATPNTLVGYLLSSKFLVGIGLISYSAYLWHQPIFSFARHISTSTSSSPHFLGILTLLTLVIAYFSWRYIEIPFRNKALYNRKQIFIGSGVFTTLLISFGLIGMSTNGYESRFSSDQQAVLAFENYDFKSMARYKDCFLNHKQDHSHFKSACRKIDRSEPISILWGDSHAAGLSFGLINELSNTIQYTAGGCPPLKDTIITDRPKCKSVNDYVLKEIANLKPKTVFMHANWTSYKEYDVRERLKETIQYIRETSPNTKLILIGSVPQWVRGLPIFMLSRNLTLASNSYATNPNLKTLKEFDRELEIAAKEEGVEYLSAIDSLCVNDQCQIITTYEGKKTLTAYDYAHLTKGGSILLVGKLLH